MTAWQLLAEWLGLTRPCQPIRGNFAIDYLCMGQYQYSNK